MIRFALPAALLLSGCSTVDGVIDRFRTSPEAATGASMAAPAPQLTAKERFVAAAEASGCVINATTMAGIMANATISQAELPPIMVELEAEGRLVADGDAAARVVTEACPGIIGS